MDTEEIFVGDSYYISGEIKTVIANEDHTNIAVRINHLDPAVHGYAWFTLNSNDSVLIPNPKSPKVGDCAFVSARCTKKFENSDVCEFTFKYNPAHLEDLLVDPAYKVRPFTLLSDDIPMPEAVDDIINLHHVVASVEISGYDIAFAMMHDHDILLNYNDAPDDNYREEWLTAAKKLQHYLDKAADKALDTCLENVLSKSAPSAK